MYERIKHLHFVGIGGIGMSGIAEVLLNLGYRVSGSDLSENTHVLRLRAMGARIYPGHAAGQTEGADAVVVSSAVKANNPEVLRARERGIPVVPRAEMLAELMRLKYGIAIAGTHGKTTTTSIIATILAQAGMDPTVVNGGVLKAFNSNARLGKGKFLVAEADESDGSFLKLNPTIAVVTNIDPEHMEHYVSVASLHDAFLKFVEKIPFYGLAVLCRDHPVVAELVTKLGDKRVVTYGFDEEADYRAVAMEQKRLHTRFEVIYRSRVTGETVHLGKVNLALAGAHNVSNTLAAIAVARELEIPWATTLSALDRFQGVDRRFDILLDTHERVIVDDYAHHPVEIEAVLQAVRQGYPDRRVVVLFQPHRYSRVKDLFDRFCQAFANADKVLVTRIYPAGEKAFSEWSDDQGRQRLVDGIKNSGHEDVEPFYLEEGAWGGVLASKLNEGDAVIFLGAGDISRKAREFAIWGAGQ